MGYIYAADVDAATESGEEAPAEMCSAPRSISRRSAAFSVVADPQGAVFMLFQPAARLAEGSQAGTPGTHWLAQLYAMDWEKAFDFYAGQFGWTKGQAIDMGAMGTYQLFAIDGQQAGGMMNKPPKSVPAWGYYFNVDAIDAARRG